MTIPRVRNGDRLSASHQNQVIDTVNSLTSGNDQVGSHVHNQLSALSVWVVNHGLPFDPNVEVTDLLGNLHYPSISWSPGVVTLVFDESVTGTARLS